MKALDRLAKVYLPLLGLICAFYFSETGGGKGARKRTSVEAFSLAVIVTAAWAALPPVFLLFGETIDSAIRTINAVDLFGNTLAVSALAFYFSKSTPTPP